jgi:hypothetical protein
LLPNVPAAQQEDFHEEPMLTFFPCLIHHGEVKTEIPQDVQGPPALLTERTNEEEMEGCLFSASGTEHTSVVIPLQLTLLPSENVSHIKSVYQKKPTKDLYLVCAFRIPDPDERSWWFNTTVMQIVKL